MSAVTVRSERPGDAGSIREVTTRAFGQPDEADMVDGLRAAGAMLESLVAEIEGTIVGHVALSPVTVEGVATLVVGVAPLSVDPDHQRQGIGTALVEALVERCRERGDPLLVVLGDPAYYGRFGFTPAEYLGMTYRDTGEAFQALPLMGDIKPPTGEAHYHPAIEGP